MLQIVGKYIGGMIDVKRFEYRVNSAQNQGLRSRLFIRQKEEIMASHDTVMNAFFHNYAKMLWEKRDTYAFLHHGNEKRHMELIQAGIFGTKFLFSRFTTEYSPNLSLADLFVILRLKRVLKTERSAMHEAIIDKSQDEPNFILASVYHMFCTILRQNCKDEERRKLL